MELSRKGAAGIALIVISIFAAAALIRASDQTELYWVTTKEIPPGERLTTEDIALARLHLPGREGIYYRADESIAGMIARNPISHGEAIARNDITDQSDNILWRLVSLDLARADIPISVAEGSIVDLYRLIDTSRVVTSISRSEITELVLTSVVVDDVIAGGALSDRTQLIVRVRLPEVRMLLDAYSEGPLLVVDHVI